jgi:hypothetical protein
VESHDQISPSPSEFLDTRPQEKSRLKAFIHRSKEALQHGGVGRYKCGSGENGFFAHATFLDYSAGLGIELRGRNP